MKFFVKIRWAASILLVFFIVLVTNVIDRKNFEKFNYSVNSLYEDRLVAHDLLFDISRILQEKQLSVVVSDSSVVESLNRKYNTELNCLMGRFGHTKLNKKEQYAFDQLQDDLKRLRQTEQSGSAMSTAEVMQVLEQMDQHLCDLSKIQLEEAKRQVFISNKAKETINLFTQWEIIFLIVMAVLIQIIILYKPKEVETS